MATRSLGKLTIDLVLRTAGFEQGADKAERRMDAIRRKTDQIARGVANFARVFTVAAAGLTYFAKQAINTQDSISKLSQTTGISTETLSELSYTAELAGVSIDEVAKGMARLSRNASDAANGLATPIRAFDRLGIAIQNTDGSLRGTEDLLLDIADKFSTLEDGTAKAALAQELFGRTGAQLIPFLNQGREGIEALNAEAEKFGLTISTEAGLAAEQFNDNLQRLQAVSRGLVSQFTQSITPALAAFTDVLIEDLKPGLEDSQESVISWGETFSLVIATVVDVARTGVATISGLFVGVGETLGATTAALVAKLKGDNDLADQIGADYRDRIGAIFDEVVNTNTTKFRDLRDDVIRRMAETADGVAPSAERIREALIFDDEGTEEAIDNYADALESFADKFKTAEERAADMRAELARFRNDLSAGQLANAEGAIFEELTGGLEEIEVNVKRRVVEPVKQAANEMSVYAEQAARNMQDAFADFLFDPFEDGLRGLLQNLVDTLRRMVAQVAASQIFDLLGGGGFGGFFGDIFGRASGGPVSAGQAYVVGERGPELFMPNVNGTIVPNGAGGNVSITQNNYIEGSNIGPEQMVQILDENNKKLKGEFVSELRRGAYG